MNIEEKIMKLNIKYFELYEAINFINERFGNMHLRIVENSKKIDKIISKDTKKKEKE